MEKDKHDIEKENKGFRSDPFCPYCNRKENINEMKIQVVNFYRCPWCGKGFGSEEEKQYMEHPAKCHYFSYYIKKMKGSL